MADNAPNNPDSLSRPQLKQLLAIAHQGMVNLSQQVMIHCIVAHWRNGECDTPTACAVLNVSEEVFKGEIQRTVDQEAVKLIALMKDYRSPKPTETPT